MHSRTNRWTALALLVALSAPSAVWAAKKYQVTGKVVEVTARTITVEKPDQDKWEIERTADLKVDGDLKVGAKVTIYYHMVADSAEVKK